MPKCALGTAAGADEADADAVVGPFNTVAGDDQRGGQDHGGARGRCAGAEEFTSR